MARVAAVVLAVAWTKSALAPALLGGISAALAAIAYRLTARLGSRALDATAGAIAGAAIVTIFLAAFAGIGSRDDEGDTAALATFLRCDLSAHQTFRHTALGLTDGLEKWAPYGTFRAISMNEAQQRLNLGDSNTTLLATYRHEIQYESGVPALVTPSGSIRPFALARRAELPAILAEIEGGDLYLVKFSPAAREPESYSELLGSFSHFRNVFVITEAPPESRYVRRGGAWVPADPAPAIDWPVANRTGLLDEGTVAFPGVARLLGDHAAAELLADPDVVLVAPNNGYLRDTPTYFNYYVPTMLGELATRSPLHEVEQNRLVTIDIFSPTISQELDALARRVDGRRFMVIGATRYDFTDQGVDIAYGIWRRLDRDDRRFRFEGFTARLPDVVARVWSNESHIGWQEILRGKFLAGVQFVETRLDVPVALAVLIFGALLRALIWPVAFMQMRSRTVRDEFGRCVGAFETFPSAANALRRRLGSTIGHELPGAIATIALVLPAFDALTSSSIMVGPALWILDISRPDSFLALVVGILVGMKASMTVGSKLSLVLIWIASTVMLMWVPAIVVLYVAGSLAVAIAQDATAMEFARWQMARVSPAVIRP